MSHYPSSTNRGRKVKSVRIGRFLGVLACAGGTVLAVGCGTQHGGTPKSQPVDLAAAVSHTQDQTARIALTIATQMPSYAADLVATPWRPGAPRFLLLSVSFLSLLTTFSSPYQF